MLDELYYIIHILPVYISVCSTDVKTILVDKVIIQDGYNIIYTYNIIHIESMHNWY